MEGHNTNINRKPLGLTGKRYLTDAEEQIKGNHIDQSSRQGHPIAKMICLLMLVEIMKNERMEREGENPRLTLKQDIKKIGKAWQVHHMKNGGEVSNKEIKGLNLEHQKVCLQNV